MLAERWHRDAPPRIVPPIGIERDYRDEIVARLDRLQAFLNSRIASTLRTLPGIDERADGAQEDAGALVAGIRAVQRQWTPIDEAPVLEVAQQVDRFTTRSTARAVNAVIPIDVAAVMANAGTVTPAHEAWARANVEFITSIEERHFDDVATAVTNAVLEGRSTRDLAKEIEARVGISQRRAAFVARDQIGTLNSQITRSRQESLGITRFRWQDSDDERVRDLHEDISGQVFDWATGHPTEGRPGEPAG